MRLVMFTYDDQALEVVIYLMGGNETHRASQAMAPRKSELVSTATSN